MSPRRAKAAPGPTPAEEARAKRIAYALRTPAAVAESARLRTLPGVRLALALEWGLHARSALVEALRRRERDLMAAERDRQLADRMAHQFTVAALSELITLGREGLAPEISDDALSIARDLAAAINAVTKCRLLDAEMQRRGRTRPAPARQKQTKGSAR